MDPYIYGLYSLIYVFLFLWGLKLPLKYRVFSLLNVLLLVTFGLIYDNLVLAMGSMIGKGSFLEGLNKIRYWFHAFFTPLLIVFAWAAIREAGIR